MILEQLALQKAQVMGLGLWYLIMTPTVCPMGYIEPEVILLRFNRYDFCKQVEADYSKDYPAYKFRCTQLGEG